MPRRPILAIDGPAGAGKSTVARRVAEELGFVLLDTGALYRTVALAAARGGVPVTDAERAGALAQSLARRDAIRIESARPQDRVLLDGEDVSAAIREPDVGMAASVVSAHPAVRKALLDMQRSAGAEGGVVAEGRDIGTVVFPNAEHKFFLTASPEVRARRRFDELVARATQPPPAFEAVLDEVRRRDDQDATRAVAPLKPAPDALLVDSTALSVDDVVAVILGRIR